MKWTNIVCSFLCIIALVLSCVSAAQVKVIKGEQGEQGIQGIQGIQGEKGEKGDKGDQGIQGVAGLNGRDGIDGVDGKDGEKGDKGDRGEQGIAGKDGKDGINGLDGKDGKDGTNGRNGRDGKDGTVVTIDSDGYWCIDGKRTDYLANYFGNASSHLGGTWMFTYKSQYGSMTTTAVEWQVILYGDFLEDMGGWAAIYCDLSEFLITPPSEIESSFSSGGWITETVCSSVAWQLKDYLAPLDLSSYVRNVYAVVLCRSNGYISSRTVNISCDWGE